MMCGERGGVRGADQAVKPLRNMPADARFGEGRRTIDRCRGPVRCLVVPRCSGVYRGNLCTVCASCDERLLVAIHVVDHGAAFVGAREGKLVAAVIVLVWCEYIGNVLIRREGAILADDGPVVTLQDRVEKSVERLALSLEAPVAGQIFLSPLDHGR